MATTEKLDYGKKAGLTEKNEYTEEQPDERLEHEKEHPNTSYQAANQHMVKFEDELRSVNEQVAMDFDRRKNPADYDASERKGMLEAVNEAFGKTEWNSASERRMAADDIAENTFQPMYRRMEIAEAAAQYKLPEPFLEELENEKIAEFKLMDGKEGEAAMFVVAKDMETARRMVAKSEGQFQIVSTWQMDHYRDQFADALYSSDKNDKAMEQMEDSLEKGIRYYNGDLPEEESDQKQASYEPDEQMEPSYRELLEFRKMETMNEYEIEHNLKEILSGKLRHTNIYLDNLQQADHPDAAAVNEVQQALHELNQAGIVKSIQRGNEENYAKIMRNTEQADLTFAQQMKEGKGSVNDTDYQQPTLPEEFLDLNEISSYADQVKDAAEEQRKNMSTLNHGLALHMLHRLNERMEAMEPVQQEWDRAGYQPGEKLPEGVASPKELSEEFHEMHGIAAGLDYLMRKEDPVYWKLNHQDAEVREKQLEGMVEQLLKDAAKEEGWEGREEERDFLMETLQAGLGKDLEYAAIREKNYLEEGETPVTAFRDSHEAVLDEMKSISSFMATVRDGTSDIKADFVGEPMEAPTYDPSGSNRDYIEDGMAFVLQYENMMGNGRHNPEGSNENLQLLHHITNQCSESMREIYHNPESFDEKIGEVVQHSQMMTAMVTKREPGMEESRSEERHTEGDEHHEEPAVHEEASAGAMEGAVENAVEAAVTAGEGAVEAAVAVAEKAEEITG